jgi:hypothetical protein
MQKAKADQVNKELEETEAAKLASLGKTRAHYEQLVENFDSGMRNQVP